MQRGGDGIHLLIQPPLLGIFYFSSFEFPALPVVKEVLLLWTDQLT